MIYYNSIPASNITASNYGIPFDGCQGGQQGANSCRVSIYCWFHSTNIFFIKKLINCLELVDIVSGYFN